MAINPVGGRSFDAIQKAHFFLHDDIRARHTGGTEWSDFKRRVGRDEFAKEAIAACKTGYFAIRVEPNKRLLIRSGMG